MKFTNYTDATITTAVALANATADTLASPADLRELVERCHARAPQAITDEDVRETLAVGARLRAALSAADVTAAAETLNELLAESGTQPFLTAHDGEPLHFHYSAPQASLPTRLAAEAAMSLAIVLRDCGLERFSVCAATDCSDVFVDTSRNRSRRYCDAATCANRAHVAAFRARKRAAHATPAR